MKALLDKLSHVFVVFKSFCLALWQKCVHRYHHTTDTLLNLWPKRRLASASSKPLFRSRSIVPQALPKIAPSPVAQLPASIPIEHVARHLRNQMLIMQGIVLSHQIHHEVTAVERAFLNYQVKTITTAYRKLIVNIARQEQRHAEHKTSSAPSTLVQRLKNQFVKSN